MFVLFRSIWIYIFWSHDEVKTSHKPPNISFSIFFVSAIFFYLSCSYLLKGLNTILQCLSKSVLKTRKCFSWPFPALSFLPGVVDIFWLFLSCRQFLLIQICWQFQHQIYLLTVPNLLFRFALLCLFNCILLPLFKVGQAGNNLSTYLNAVFGWPSRKKSQQLSTTPGRKGRAGKDRESYMDTLGDEVEDEIQAKIWLLAFEQLRAAERKNIAEMKKMENEIFGGL